jgi:hypothetical protein
VSEPGLAAPAPKNAVEAFRTAFLAAVDPAECLPRFSAVEAGLATAAPLIAAQALRSAYWKLREHASGYRGADAFRRVLERYEASDRDERLYRGVVLNEWFARGIEAAASDVADLLGVEEYDIEGERGDELERGTDHA